MRSSTDESGLARAAGHHPAGAPLAGDGQRAATGAPPAAARGAAAVLTAPGRRALSVVALFALAAGVTGCGQEPAAPERPNILLIVADDLGYGDVGFNGSEIPTPNIDDLAGRGMIMRNFYAGMTCSPTRSMLLSGVDNHLAGVGVQGRPIREEHQGQDGYVGYLNFRVASLAELMTDSGYDTYMTGKWHLGPDVETGPRARGFKRSFVSLDGAAHLGPWDWRGPQAAEYRDGDELVHVGDDYYSTRFYTEKLIEYIEADRADDRPFFAYLAYTAPHWPLQAPAESIAKFSGRYDAGYEALYASRLERQKSMGLVAASATPIDPARFEPRWHTLSDDERAIEARKMEIFAAMVSDLDAYIGRVIDYLKSIDEYDNTLIVFISDNGPESSRTDLGPRIVSHIGVEYDHSLDNLGSPTSYVAYGRNWASASATPFNRHKSTGFEGGIHVPAFVHFPAAIAGGAQTEATVTVADLLPTFLEFAGTSHPGTPYKGRDVHLPQGVSLRPLWIGETASIRTSNHEFGWELLGHRSIRRGDWKIVWDRAEPAEARRWRLFDLSTDPFEQRDLAAERPEVFAEMLDAWDRYEAENGVIF